MKKLTLFGLVAVTFLASPGLAQEATHSGHAAMQHTARQGPNGGTLQQVDQNQVETVLMKKGVLFFVWDSQGNMIQAPGASGSISLKVGENPKSYSYKLQALKNHAIGAAIDLSKVEGVALHMDVELEGVGAAGKLKFHALGRLGDTPSDAMLISLQKTCPVSGKPLGSMGAPPKVMVDGKPLFVCCAGCTGEVKAHPEKYLEKYYSAKGEQVRPGVFTSTLADANAIAAQKKCPVMDEELGGMGVPQKVDVNGKAVYICCAGCAKKLHAEPEKYLAILAKQGVTPPDFK